MRVAVTGANGFVGGAVARDLVARGHSVVGFGRAAPGRNGADSGLAGYRMWDLTSGALDSAPHADAVVHAAALADDWASLELATAVNLRGTAAVIATFPGARYVHISTSSVYDAFTPTIDATERAPAPTRFLSNYSRTKLAAEALFAGRNAAILRPHAVYGPGDTTLMPRLMSAVRGARLTLPGGGLVLHTLTSIGNLTQAVALAIGDGTPVGTFNVGDAEPVILAGALRDLVEQRTGSTVELRSVPYRLAYAAAEIAELAARVSRGRPPITRYAVSQLGLERTLNLTAARERLGFDPALTSFEGASDW